MFHNNFSYTIMPIVIYCRIFQSNFFLLFLDSCFVILGGTWILIFIISKSCNQLSIAINPFSHQLIECNCEWYKISCNISNINMNYEVWPCIIVFRKAWNFVSCLLCFPSLRSNCGCHLKLLILIPYKKVIWWVIVV